MLQLWCVGKLCECQPHEHRFHITCLWCRTRRKYIGKFHDPKYWIRYTYTSWYAENLEKEHVANGKAYFTNDGSPLRVRYYFTLRIDPRGHFTRLRCAAIMLIDRFMLRYGTSGKTSQGSSHGMRKPLAEVCEFLANYP